MPALRFIFVAFILNCIINDAVAQPDAVLSPGELKKLSFEELMNIEISSVSKQPEKLTEVASAIQVVTGEDIRRSTATRLPEALRLAPNLQVAQVSSRDWAVTARGFNGAPLSTSLTLSDKLLVMIDGRTVYSPLFAGVFWDVQNVLLEDVDRIEVVSGPGGTLWGANAMNGVINVMSKSAEKTQGLFVSETAGDLLNFHGAARYGGRIDSHLFYRVYGQYYNQDNTLLKSDSDARDGWNMLQSGFRMDYVPTPKNTFTLQGDFYGGKDDTSSVLVNGQNVIARWTHVLSEKSNWILQAYFDRTYRDLRASNFQDVLRTYDVEFQHHFELRKRHKLLWGAGYRLMDNNVISKSAVFNPANRNLHLFNGFVQDQVTLVPKRVALTVGTKLLHNDYTGFELQPSVRMAWTPNTKNTLWAAVSHTVRTPSRLDAEIVTLTTSKVPFKSEKVMAYEVGYRGHPAEKVTYSIAAFYNKYNDVRSVDTNSLPPPAFIFANSHKVTSKGFELSGNLFVTDWWRIRGGYTFLDKEFMTTSPKVIPGVEVLEAIDPAHQVLLQSIMDLPSNVQIDITGRYIDDLPALGTTGKVPSYLTFNMRVGWTYKRFTFSLAGQNLAQDKHREFGSRQIPRSFYQKISYRF